MFILLCDTSETYKANGGGDEIDSALRIGTEPNDDNREIPPLDPNGPRYRPRQEPQPTSPPVEPTQTGKLIPATPTTGRHRRSTQFSAIETYKRSRVCIACL